MTDSSKGLKCSICGTALTGAFCHNCGQKSTNKKTSVADIFKALLSGIFSIERGIIGIIRDLTINPRKVVENYWQGNRFYHYSPGQMIFYTIFIIGLHLVFVGKTILGFFSMNVAGIKGEALTILSPQFFFILSLLPLFSLTTYLSFFRNKNSFSEHFVSATYIFSYSAILCTIISDLLHLLFGVNLQFTAPMFLLTLFIWSARVFVLNKKWYNYLVALIIQVVLFFLILAILIGVLYLIKPDMVNLTKV